MFTDQGLPGQSLQDWSETARLNSKLEQLKQLRPAGRFFRDAVKSSCLSPGWGEKSKEFAPIVFHLTLPA